MFTQDDSKPKYFPVWIPSSQISLRLVSFDYCLRRASKDREGGLSVKNEARKPLRSE